MPGQTYPFIVASGERKSVGPIGFIPAAIGVDNPTPFSVHFPNAPFGAWVSPFTRGAVVPAPTETRSITYSSMDLPPEAAPGSVVQLSSAVANCIIYEDSQPPSPGIPILGGALRSALYALAFSLDTRAVGTYTYDIQNNPGKGIVLMGQQNSGGNIQITIQSFDPNFNNFFNLMIGASFTGGQRLVIYPGLTNVGGPYATPASVLSDVLGQNTRISMQVIGTPSLCGVSYSLIP